MAKKTASTTTDGEEPVIDYTNIHETPMEDIIAEPGEATATGEAAAAATGEAGAAAATGSTGEGEEVEVEFDPEKFGEEISEKTAKKIIEAQTHRPEPDKEVDKELQAPWIKENRNPKDWEEIADWGVTKKGILDKREHEAETAEQEKVKKETEEFNKKQVEEFNKFTDDQLKDLTDAGKIKTPEERKALFQAMLDTNIARQKEGKAPIYSIKEIFYEHYTAPKPGAQPAGADAPVAPSAGGVTTEEKEVNYNDVHKKTFIDILMGK